MESAYSNQTNFDNKKQYFFAKRPFIIWGIILLFVLGLIGAYSIGKVTTSSTASNTSIAKPTAIKTINKDFSFPVRDAKGNVVTNFTFSLLSAQLQNQIIIEGQKADSVQGRTFFIINLKITNPSSQSIQLNSRDFIRIQVDANKELLAPEIHNDPVTVQPISTKYTRLGLPVDSSVHKFTLSVGEISGPKVMVPISL